MKELNIRVLTKEGIDEVISGVTSVTTTGGKLIVYANLTTIYNLEDVLFYQVYGV